jgi:Icc-related predicted phosphoesterase
MRLVIISDTHNLLSRMDVPDGDILIHCGDFCSAGTMPEVEQFRKDFQALPHKHKIVVAGNHDWPFQREQDAARQAFNQFTYLEDEGTEVDGLKLYGSPWQPAFGRWAFNLPRKSAELADKWRRIPDDVDVLITHGPPHGILDRVKFGTRVGCEHLRERVDKVQPRVHCFGHIHEAYGQEQHGDTLFVNAASVDIWYHLSNPAAVVDLVV